LAASDERDEGGDDERDRLQEASWHAFVRGAKTVPTLAHASTRIRGDEMDRIGPTLCWVRLVRPLQRHDRRTRAEDIEAVAPADIITEQPPSAGTRRRGGTRDSGSARTRTTRRSARPPPRPPSGAGTRGAPPATPATDHRP